MGVTSTITTMGDQKEDKKAMLDSERVEELKAFEDTKLGVKGLVDAGITKIPRIFHHSLDNNINIKKASELGYTDYAIPVIDLANFHDHDEDSSVRKRVIERVRDASEKWGFFQIVNHGIPLSSLEEMKDGVLRFFEQDSEVKKGFYTRDYQRPFVYSNFNLYSSAPISWKDSFLCNLAPNRPKPEDMPAVCRYTHHSGSAKVISLSVFIIYSSSVSSIVCNNEFLIYLRAR